jgi:hypothetical protein
MTPKQAHREGVMRRAEGRCFWEHVCSGPLQAHHVIPVQRLRHEHSHTAWAGGDHPLLGVTFDELIADPRNGVALCEVAHRAWENGTARPLRHQLPACVEEFAADYELLWSLDQDFGNDDDSLFGEAA